jgi:two-component system, OmpR family, sensor histidine kinase CreC
VKLGRLLFAAYFTITALCFAYPLWMIGDRLRIVYLESAEEPLVDTANILAELIGQDAELTQLDVTRLYALFERLETRPLDARIYEITKREVDLDIYVTDARGTLLFDSRNRDNVGRDYSMWRDVSRTLNGQYGARVSSHKSDLTIPHALYVAAPIRVQGEIVGVLTVVKPTTAVKTFLRSVRPRMLLLGGLAGGLALVLAWVVSMWVTQQVGRLTRYADDVRQGQRVPFPKLADTELRTMGLAFERMRESLAGHRYVEQYVRALTHEIKSPLSGIRGAAEILATPDLDPAQRERFLANLEAEGRRIQDLVDRMLELSELEVRRALPERKRVAIAPILRTLIESQQPTASQKSLVVHLDASDDLYVEGDTFLLHLALSNLLKNAIEFSPQAGTVRIHGARDGSRLRISVDDQGPGIPDYARERVFERFYSLERPDTGRKSTGLGLNFVKEIAALHQGDVQLENLPERGLRASLWLPAAG